MRKLITIFAIPELRRKILITLLFLVIYRIGYCVPLPMVDQAKLAKKMAEQSGGSLGQVAWSRDGALLAGGSYWSAATGSPIFRWGDSGWSKRTTLAAGDETVMGIAPAADGGFAYVTADPTFGHYDAKLNRA